MRRGNAIQCFNFHTHFLHTHLLVLWTCSSSHRVHRERASGEHYTTWKIATLGTFNISRLNKKERYILWSSVELELNWIFSLINSSKIYCVLSSSIFQLIHSLLNWLNRRRPVYGEGGKRLKQKCLVSCTQAAWEHDRVRKREDECEKVESQ